jgi:acetyl esterase/lipase
MGLLLLSAGCEHKHDVEEDVSYDASIGYAGTFDVYEPTGDSVRMNRPAVLAIHGGGWISGDKVWGRQIATELCPFGYVVFSINYRLSGRPDGKWPAQIEDVQKALRYIRANAGRFRIDPNRIASLGMSAGGHLATMVALRDDPAGPDGRVSVAINLDGQHDLTIPQDQVMGNFVELLTNVMGHAAPWSDAELRDISTVTFARPDVALLTVHGTRDDNVYFTQGERITAVLQAKGAETEFIPIEGGCHSNCWKAAAAREGIHRFLDRKLSHDGNKFFEDRQGTTLPWRQ